MEPKINFDYFNNKSIEDYIKDLEGFNLNMGLYIPIPDNKKFKDLLINFVNETDSIILGVIEYLSTLHAGPFYEQEVFPKSANCYSSYNPYHNKSTECFRKLYAYLLVITKSFSRNIEHHMLDDCSIDFIEGDTIGHSIIINHEKFMIRFGSDWECYIILWDPYIDKFVSRKFSVNSLYSYPFILLYVLNKTIFDVVFSLITKSSDRQITIEDIMNEYLSPIFSFEPGYGYFWYDYCEEGWTAYDYIKYMIRAEKRQEGLVNFIINTANLPPIIKTNSFGGSVYINFSCRRQESVEGVPENSISDLGRDDK